MVKVFKTGLILSVFLLSGRYAVSLSTESTEQNIAFCYFKQAEKLYNSGDISSVKELLKISLEFFPDFSEANFLYSRLNLQKQETTYQGIEYLEKAINADSWVSTNPYLAKLKLAEVLLRTGQFKRANRILLELGNQRIENTDIALLRAQYLKGMRETQRLKNYLSDALKRFPKTLKFYLLYTEVLDETGDINRAKAVLAAGLNEFPHEPALLYAQARIEQNPKTRIALIKEYFISNGRDPGAALLGLHSEPDNPRYYLKLFLSLGGNSYVDYLEEAYRLLKTDHDLLKELVDASLNYSGMRFVDSNHDGYYEERYRYSQGKLESLELDSNQDGAAEIEIKFISKAGSNSDSTAGNAIPVQVILLNEEDSRIRYHYSEYPFLYSISFPIAQGREVYHLLPNQFVLEILTRSSEAGDSYFRLYLHNDPGWASKKDILIHSFRMDEYVSESVYPARVYTYSGGQIVRLNEDPNEDGLFRRIVHYRGSAPALGFRDLDGDGHYEIREEYSEGGLIKIALDQDGNGKFEYVQIINPNTEMYWDYNGDGVYDSREYELSDGRLIREFSSSLNGTFDLKALFIKGILKRVERGRRVIPVSYDPERDLFWIGPPGTPPLSLSEGIQRMNNREYFIFHNLGRIYIEELQ